MLDLSIVIVSFNTKKLLTECLDSVVAETSEVDYEVIVVDNASSDGSQQAAKAYKKKVKKGGKRGGLRRFRVIENKQNVGFAKANNQGIKKSEGRYILLLNSDTKLTSDVLSEMVSWMDKHDKAGVSSCALLNTDGSLQGTGGYFPTLIRVFSWMTIQDIPFVDYLIKPFHPMKSKSFSKGVKFYKEKKQLDWVTGAFFLVKKEVVEKVGVFDEDYFMYVEEVDYCYRIKKAGWQIWYLPQWNILHYGGASGTSQLSVLAEFEGIKRFYRKHHPSWQYPILRFLLKFGALGRIVLFGLLEGRRAAQTYAKAARMA